MTPQQRKEIYEKMLQEFEDDPEYIFQTGLCRSLMNVSDGEIEDIHNFPELMRQAPKSPAYGQFWWPIGRHSNGRDRRMQVLKKAIKSVEKLIHD